MNILALFLLCPGLLSASTVVAKQKAVEDTLAIRGNARASGEIATKGGGNVKVNADFFPILPWGPLPSWGVPEGAVESELKGMAECNFTMAAFMKPEFLPLCEKVGLKAIVHPTIAGIGTWGRAWKDLTDEEIRDRVRALVKAAGESDAVFGYYLQDEPSVHDFPALAKAVAAVKEFAPGKIAYINLFPDYAILGDKDISRLGTGDYNEYVGRFVSEVKPHILSYDNYTVQYSKDLADAHRAASYYRNLLEIRRVALENGLPFWNIVSSNQIRPFTPVPSPANLAFQAYTTLAAGGRGISWYTYYARNYGYAPIDGSGNRTETWYFLREINRQIRTLSPILNRLQSTGVFFTDPPPAPGLGILPGDIVRSVESDSSIMVGEFRAEDGEAYVMIVNLSLEKSVNVKIKTQKEFEHVQIISSVDGRASAYDREKGHWLTAGHGVLIRMH